MAAETIEGAELALTRVFRRRVHRSSRSVSGREPAPACCSQIPPDRLLALSLLPQGCLLGRATTCPGRQAQISYGCRFRSQDVAKSTSRNSFLATQFSVEKRLFDDLKLPPF